jgi:hypothetical protein
MFQALVAALLLCTVKVQMQGQPAPAPVAPASPDLLAPAGDSPDRTLIAASAKRMAAALSAKTGKKYEVDAVLFSMSTEGKWAFVVLKGPDMHFGLMIVWEDGQWKPMETFSP